MNVHSKASRLARVGSGLAVACLSLSFFAASAFADSLAVGGSYLTNSASTSPDVKGTLLSVTYSSTAGIGHLVATGKTSTYFPNGTSFSGTTITTGAGLYDLSVFFNSDGTVLTNDAGHLNTLSISDTSPTTYFASSQLLKMGYALTSSGGTVLGDLEFTFGGNTGSVSTGKNVGVFLALDNVIGLNAANLASPASVFGTTSWSDTQNAAQSATNAFALAAPLPNTFLAGLGLFGCLAVGTQIRRRSSLVAH